ncbi:MAG: hypothetical protein R2880_19925 [Deinococcales bacterium]
MSTVKLPHYEMGKRAVEYLIQEEQEAANLPMQEKIKGRLIVRKSS